MVSVTRVFSFAAAVILALASLFVLSGCASTDTSVGITSAQGPRTPDGAR